MNAAKIIQYILSFLHIVAQIFYFRLLVNRIGEIGSLARKIDPATLSNANFGLNSECFIYLGLSLLTLCAYLTVSHHLGLMILDKSGQQSAGKKD